MCLYFHSMYSVGRNLSIHLLLYDTYDQGQFDGCMNSVDIKTHSMKLSFGSQFDYHLITRIEIFACHVLPCFSNRLKARVVYCQSQLLFIYTCK